MSAIMPQFLEVVQQHISGVVGNVYIVLQLWKNFENRYIFDEIIVKIRHMQIVGNYHKSYITAILTITTKNWYINTGNKIINSQHSPQTISDHVINS